MSFFPNIMVYLFKWKKWNQTTTEPISQQNSKKSKLSFKFKRNKISSDSLNSTEDERVYIINQIKALQRSPKWYDPILDCMTDFCETTGLHGAVHITRTGSPRGNRIGWFFIVAIALTISTILLYISWNWGDETPTKQVISSVHAPLYFIPFPAVTICTNNRISKQRATELSTQFKYTNYTPTDFLKLFKLTMATRAGFTETEDKYLTFDRIIKNNNYTFDKLLQFLSPNCSDLISKCMWKGESRKCDAMFQDVNTAFGRCCTFNYFGKNQTRFSQRVVLRNEIDKVPQRVTSVGRKSGVTLLIKPNSADYFATYYGHQGLKTFFHDSYNFADENAAVAFTPIRSEAHIQLTAKQTFATAEVRDLDPSIRNCLFDDEKELNYMQRYSLVNCYAECRSQLIEELCGCIPESLPRNRSNKFCEIGDLPCVLKHRARQISSALPGFRLQNTTNETTTNTNDNPCNCLPDCQINQYSALSFATTLDRNFSYSLKQIFKTKIELTDEILLHIYFSDLMITRYKMTTFQSWLEILASFGGLLGFVIGFSIVTSGEFLFALFISPILNHYKL